MMHIYSEIIDFILYNQSYFAEELLNNFSQQSDSWRISLYFVANTRNEYVIMYCFTVLDVSAHHAVFRGSSIDHMVLLSRYSVEPYQPAVVGCSRRKQERNTRYSQRLSHVLPPGRATVRAQQTLQADCRHWAL